MLRKAVNIGRAIRNTKCRYFATAKPETSQTHFGFQTVSEEEKSQKVKAVFEGVAGKYDRMNDAMSIGIHRFWKDYFVQKLGPTPAAKILDVGGGTGDIAKRIVRSTSLSDEEGALVTVCDISEGMLGVGKTRCVQEGWDHGVDWVHGNAECLPFQSNSFDAYTIAFAIRNCTHIQKVLEEAYRVLRPGGRFLCLEFSQVPNPALSGLYDWYSFQVIPVMGQVIAGDWDSYQYLVESIRKFPRKLEFQGMMETAGFSCTDYEDLSFGIVSIHSGFKL